MQGVSALAATTVVAHVDAQGGHQQRDHFLVRRSRRWRVTCWARASPASRSSHIGCPARPLSLRKRGPLEGQLPEVRSALQRDPSKHAILKQAAKRQGQGVIAGSDEHRPEAAAVELVQHVLHQFRADPHEIVLPDRDPGRSRPRGWRYPQARWGQRKPCTTATSRAGSARAADRLRRGRSRPRSRNLLSMGAPRQPPACRGAPSRAFVHGGDWTRLVLRRQHRVPQRGQGLFQRSGARSSRVLESLSALRGYSTTSGDSWSWARTAGTLVDSKFPPLFRRMRCKRAHRRGFSVLGEGHFESLWGRLIHL
jgi:hypothetical protein